MNSIDRRNHGDGNRRGFLSAAATIAFAQLGLPIAAQVAVAAPVTLPTVKPGTTTSFRSLKHIDAGVLRVGYAEDGPPGGPP
ncbi:MAG TPA: hypothetical protein VJN67_04700 [Stellaceae bacterium]|nr:hypothetical protein [Stellaceae bacterium]